MRFQAVRHAALAAAVLALASPAGAQDEDGVENSGTFETGVDLYQACTSEDDVETEHCYGYIMGVSDTITLFADYGWVEAGACVPADMAIETLRVVVVDYIAASDGDYSAVSMVNSALEEAYPCDGGDEESVSATTA